MQSNGIGRKRFDVPAVLGIRTCASSIRKLHAIGMLPAIDMAMPNRIVIGR